MTPQIPALPGRLVLGVEDILRAIQRHGSLTLHQLEEAIPEPADGSDDGFHAALDECVDEGYLRLSWRRDGELEDDQYRLTAKGRERLRQA